MDFAGDFKKGFMLSMAAYSHGTKSGHIPG